MPSRPWVCYAVDFSEFSRVKHFQLWKTMFLEATTVFNFSDHQKNPRIGERTPNCLIICSTKQKEKRGPISFPNVTELRLRFLPWSPRGLLESTDESNKCWWDWLYRLKRCVPSYLISEKLIKQDSGQKLVCRHALHHWAHVCHWEVAALLWASVSPHVKWGQ